jgi:signal transduction histidine kinase
VKLERKQIEQNTNINDINLDHTHLYADKNKLKQIMRNLISNGLKFSPSGGTVDILVDIIDDNNSSNISKGNNNNHHYINNVRNSILWKGNLKDSIISTKSKWLRVRVVDSGAGISEVNF